MLKDEIKERAEGMPDQPRCGHWTSDRCIELLETQGPVEPRAEAAEPVPVETPRAASWRRRASRA